MRATEQLAVQRVAEAHRPPPAVVVEHHQAGLLEPLERRARDELGERRHADGAGQGDQLEGGDVVVGEAVEAGDEQLRQPGRGPGPVDEAVHRPVPHEAAFDPGPGEELRGRTGGCPR